MLRIALVFLLVLVLSSCNTTVKQPEFPLKYDGSVCVTYNGTNYLADIEYSPGSMYLSLAEPEQLCGLSIEFTNDEVKVCRDSLELTYRYDFSETILPIRFAFEALEYLNSEKLEFILKDNLIYTQFSIENKVCEVSLRKDSYKLVTLNYNGFSFEFQ